MRMRRGFTLVEVLVAVLLIDVGLLAVVAGSAVVIRRQNELRLRGAAASAAANRVQTLIGIGCRPGGGSALTGTGVREAWDVRRGDRGTWDIRDSVTYTIGTVTHATVVTTRIPC